jgi:hypothetical protein
VRSVAIAVPVGLAQRARDPAWDSQGVSGPIEIGPAFAKIEAATKAKDDSGGADDAAIPGCPKDPVDCAKKKQEQKDAKKNASAPSWFLLSGTNLSTLEWAEKIVDDVPANYCGFEIGCIQILADANDGPKHVAPADIKVASNTNMWVKLPKDAGGVHVFWSRDNIPASEWDLAIK